MTISMCLVAECREDLFPWAYSTYDIPNHRPAPILPKRNEKNCPLSSTFSSALPFFSSLSPLFLPTYSTPQYLQRVEYLVP